MKITISIKEEDYQLLKQQSEETGVPMSKIITKALKMQRTDNKSVNN